MMAQIVITLVSLCWFKEKEKGAFSTNQWKTKHPPDQTRKILKGILYKKQFKNGTFSHQTDADYSFFEEEKN